VPPVPGTTPVEKIRLMGTEFWVSEREQILGRCLDREPKQRDYWRWKACARVLDSHEHYDSPQSLNRDDAPARQRYY
jgi:hypothetical protein